MHGARGWPKNGREAKNEHHGRETRRGAHVRIGWLSSGRDAAARELLSETVRRAGRDGVALDIGCVFCDRAPGEHPESDRFLDLVTSLGFPAITLSSARSWKEWWSVDTTPGHVEGAHKHDVREAWRDAFHFIVGEQLKAFDLDLLVLAGYMLVVSPDMCERYSMLNLHPALPGGPAGTWQDVIWELLRTDARETGAMIHLVTSELDQGPVVSYCSFPIAGGAFDPLWMQFRRKRERRGLGSISIDDGEREPLFAEIRRRGALREIPLVYQTVRQFVEGRLTTTGGDVHAIDDELPMDLTDAVEADLAADREGSDR
jgi:phosphoribosylglycinamide formyltransferase 1